MSGPIFPAVLGDKFHELPEPLQDLHRGERSSYWQGDASIRGAHKFVGRVVATLIGFPSDDQRTAAQVSIDITREGETWVRTFGDKQFLSHLSLGTGREAGLVCERFGIVTIAIAIVWKDERLWFIPRRWRIGPLPLPNVLLPKGNSFERVRKGLFEFNVCIEVPFIGLIAAYEGTLQPR